MPSRKKSKNKWFKKVRGSYLPVNAQGWLTYLPFVGYLVATFFFTHRLTISGTIKVYLVVIQWLFATLLMTLIAQQKS
jgi:uncharacterized membrane protein (GlpM family)